MVRYLLLFFVAGMELLCLALGGVMDEVGTSREIHALWIGALWSIPCCGIPAAAVMGRRCGRAPGIFAGALGVGISIYWGWQAAVFKMEPEHFAGSIVACMALAASLLLAAAGLSGIAGAYGARRPSS
jgi:hypothetical protein